MKIIDVFEKLSKLCFSNKILPLFFSSKNETKVYIVCSRTDDYFSFDPEGTHTKFSGEATKFLFKEII
jgi:hypothetical protein